MSEFIEKEFGKFIAIMKRNLEILEKSKENTASIGQVKFDLQTEELAKIIKEMFVSLFPDITMTGLRLNTKLRI
ncbi:MAG: hypothetical protein H0Z19_07465 [Archaeoglobus sp.]|uniref:hypothetical protein n=1 Tax=Archaeoglobus sp. TaxID=1872626 RepID=UPI001D9A740E|nr:hypothetical protein [Archaeoglobus sp.]MBO8180303.1 hypothetical protein [Archaeoglobus sp.]